MHIETVSAIAEAHSLNNSGIAVAAGVVWALLGTFIILKVVESLTPLRVSREDELTGLDLSLHGEVAYNYNAPSMGSISGRKE